MNITDREAALVREQYEAEHTWTYSIIARKHGSTGLPMRYDGTLYGPETHGEARLDLYKVYEHIHIITLERYAFKPEQQ